MRPAIWCGELSTDPQTHRVRASNTRSDFVPKLPGSMPLSCVVLRDQGGDLSAFLEYFIGNLAREINVLRGRSGTVFPRRFSAEEILDDEAFAGRIRCTLLNPADARLETLRTSSSDSAAPRVDREALEVPSRAPRRPPRRRPHAQTRRRAVTAGPTVTANSGESLLNISDRPPKIGHRGHRLNWGGAAPRGTPAGGVRRWRA